MKRALSVAVCLLVLGGSSAPAQFRSQVPRESSVGSGLTSSGGSSFLFGWFSPENFQMRHTVGFSYVTMGGQSVSLGTYTNSMMYRFAENLNARADITMSYSPYSTFADKYGSAPQGLNGIHLSRAEINYRVSPSTGSNGCAGTRSTRCRRGPADNNRPESEVLPESCRGSVT